MATLSRQPFAPLDATRIQNLTSLKNRQNAISPVSGAKRKAADLADDDFENVDPILFSKRSKGVDLDLTKDTLKAPTLFLTKSPLSTLTSSSVSPMRHASSTPRARSILQPKSPISKINTTAITSTPLTAPAGRSPTRGKKTGLLSNRRRTAGPYSRIDPPSFGISATATPAPFSLDAALRGTIPGYSGKAPVTAPTRNSTYPDDASLTLSGSDAKASWFFDIHEDTPEQEMTNLLQHNTCILDISSDEESEKRARKEKAEGRDKENIPPADDVSQTSANRSSARRTTDYDMVVEKERFALAEIDVAELYAASAEEASVIIVPGDEDDEAEEAAFAGESASTGLLELEPQATLESLEPLADIKDVDELMSRADESPSKAAVLEPIEGTGESFDLWESGSAKDEQEVSAATESDESLAAQ